MRQEFNRHVPTGNILNDRWELAQSFNWGNKSSVYDDSLILGNVNVGLNCWVGPFTILDGNAFSHQDRRLDINWRWDSYLHPPYYRSST